jgi:hypothetical protein
MTKNTQMSQNQHTETTRTGVDPASIELPPTYSIDITSVVEVEFEKASPRS